MALRAAIEFFQMSKKVAKGDLRSGHIPPPSCMRVSATLKARYNKGAARNFNCNTITVIKRAAGEIELDIRLAICHE